MSEHTPSVSERVRHTVGSATAGALDQRLEVDSTTSHPAGSTGAGHLGFARHSSHPLGHGGAASTRSASARTSAASSSPAAAASSSSSSSFQRTDPSDDTTRSSLSSV